MFSDWLDKTLNIGSCSSKIVSRVQNFRLLHVTIFLHAAWYGRLMNTPLENRNSSAVSKLITHDVLLYQVYIVSRLYGAWLGSHISLTFNVTKRHQSYVNLYLRAAPYCLRMITMSDTTLFLRLVPLAFDV